MVKRLLRKEATGKEATAKLPLKADITDISSRLHRNPCHRS